MKTMTPKTMKIVKHLVCLVFVARWVADVEGINLECPSPQFLESGTKASLNCQFPQTFHRVMWYVPPNNQPFIALEGGAISGPGYESGEFNVSSNGVLQINDVSLEHEHLFRVVVLYNEDLEDDIKQNIQVQVFVKPKQSFPEVDMCGRESYCLVEVDDPINATCSIDQSRPSVKLQWLKKNHDEERKLEAQTQTTQHDNLNSTSAVTTVEVMEGNILDVIVCRGISEAPLLEQADTMALLEANVKEFPEDFEDLLVENGKSVLLDIKMPDIYAVVWKKLSTWSSEYETIGHYAFGKSKISNPDSFITSNGSLQIRKLRVNHEGNYICIYATPKEQGIRMFFLNTLILPSPPFPTITGCKQRNNCHVQIVVAGELSCALRGIRPFATLEWSYLGEGNPPINFHAKTRLYLRNYDTFDAFDTTEFEIKSKNYLSFNVSCRSVSAFEDMPQLSSMVTLHLSPEALELIEVPFYLTTYFEVVSQAVFYGSPVLILILIVSYVVLFPKHFRICKLIEATLNGITDTINKNPGKNLFETIYLENATIGELRAVNFVKATLEEEREPNDEQDTEEESTRADTTQTNEEPKNQEEGMNNGHVKKDKGNKEEEETVVEIHASENDPMMTDENTDGYEMKNVQA